MKCRRRWRKQALRTLWPKQGGRCAYCQQPMDLKDAYSPRFCTVDHIVPTSRGGDRRDFGNITLACQRCNVHKNDRTPSEWFADLIETISLPHTTVRL